MVSICQTPFPPLPADVICEQPLMSDFFLSHLVGNLVGHLVYLHVNHFFVGCHVGYYVRDSDVNLKVSLTNGLTDRLTGVGARETCMSKNLSFQVGQIPTCPYPLGHNGAGLPFQCQTTNPHQHRLSEHYHPDHQYENNKINIVCKP